MRPAARRRQEWWRGIGRTACSLVPRPSGLSIVSVPPKAETRSASPSSPPPVVGQAPPQPSSPDVDGDRVDVLAHAHGRRRRARVLGGVRECLGDEVVGACLELGVETRDPARRARPAGRRRAAARAARRPPPRPCSASTEGWRPRASSRISPTASASCSSRPLRAAPPHRRRRAPSEPMRRGAPGGRRSAAAARRRGGSARAAAARRRGPARADRGRRAARAPSA